MGEIMRILVTGGMGFIGSNFIRHTLQKHENYEIINYDKLTYAGNPDNLKDIENNQRYKFIKGDICDNVLIHESVKDVDAIVNFAAETHVDRSIKDAGDFITTNVYGTHVLLEATRKHDIKTYLHISTDEVYGSIEENSFKETDILYPSNPYSASKAGADLLVLSYYNTYGLQGKITRSSNNFGPYQYPEKLIPSFILKALGDEKLPIYGTGENVRDWIYVEDNCRALDAVLHDGKPGEIYNIGASNEKTNIEITKMILDKLEKPESLITYVEDRAGHDFRYSLDSTKVRNLGWQPKYEFGKGMEKTISWYVENEWWWSSFI